MNKQELDQAMQALTDWSLIIENATQQLEKSFALNNFVDAMQLAQAITVFAEQENHHPSLLVEWGSLRVRWWTHDTRGITTKDIICAKQTDSIFNQI